jgi:predicted ATP-dependent endonuclease of OLD family
LELTAFRVQMYKSVLDSGWIQIEHLTVLMGKNESCKTSLLKGLHKLNPFKPEPYSIPREWPRGHRDVRSPEQIVCTAHFKLDAEELGELKEIAGKEIPFEELEVSRNYKGQLLTSFREDFFSGRLRPNQVDQACSVLPAIPEPVGDGFRNEAQRLQLELKRLGYEGRFQELRTLQVKHTDALQALMNPNLEPHVQNEQNYVTHTGRKSLRLLRTSKRCRRTTRPHMSSLQRNSRRSSTWTTIVFLPVLRFSIK